MLQSPQWQAETIPLDYAARPTFILEEFLAENFLSFDKTISLTISKFYTGSQTRKAEIK
jgi:hypothetical protein